MRAAVFQAAGQPLSIERVDEPPPLADQVIIEVHRRFLRFALPRLLYVLTTIRAGNARRAARPNCSVRFFPPPEGDPSTAL
jgi:hypothetical protein